MLAISPRPFVMISKSSHRPHFRIFSVAMELPVGTLAR